MLQYISNSSASTFRRCTYKFEQLYHAPKGNTPVEQGAGQRIGSAGHKALAALYAGYSFSAAIDIAYEEYNPLDEQDQLQFDNLTSVLRTYREQILVDNWIPQEIELEVKVLRYMGILDLVARVGSEYYIVDHKFQKSVSFAHIKFDTQISFYLMLANLHPFRYPIKGLIYNIVSTSKSDTKPARKIAYRSPQALEIFRKELDKQIALMDNFNPNYHSYRNLHRDCPWDCGIYAYCMQRLKGNYG